MCVYYSVLYIVLTTCVYRSSLLWMLVVVPANSSSSRDWSTTREGWSLHSFNKWWLKTLERNKRENQKRTEREREKWERNESKRERGEWKREWKDRELMSRWAPELLSIVQFFQKIDWGLYKRWIILQGHIQGNPLHIIYRALWRDHHSTVPLRY